MAEIRDRFEAGDLEEARKVEERLLPLYEALNVTTNPMPLKAALEMLGICSGRVRLPMVPLDDGQAAVIRDGARAARTAGGRVSSKLRILPLGGLGEIGKNMTVVELDGRIVVVDVGLMFPTAEMLGIDLVLPDFRYLRDRVDDIDAIVLTHGHEDHVGALPYFLREIGIPPAIYGGRLTIGMVRSKLEEHKLRDVPLRDLETGRIVEEGPFGIEMIHMSHSIPDACAVALHTDVGTVLLTGDYKFDQTPVDGVPADFARLAELGRDGLLCLCGDSTNADRTGVAPSESSVGPALLETFGRCEGRIIVTCFASNVHRVQQVIDAAARARSQGRAGRALDAQELQHRIQPRNRQRARRPADPAARDRGVPGRERSSRSRPAARASRCRRCAGWRMGTIATSSSTRATRSSSRRRPCPAMSAR